MPLQVESSEENDLLPFTTTGTFLQWKLFQTLGLEPNLMILVVPLLSDDLSTHHDAVFSLLHAY